MGITSAVDMPPRQALIIELVEGSEDLPPAIALNSALFNGAATHRAQSSIPLALARGAIDRGTADPVAGVRGAVRSQPDFVEFRPPPSLARH